jgi:hypothetical protein
MMAGAEFGELSGCLGLEVDATWAGEMASRDADFEELKETRYCGECGDIEVGPGSNVAYVEPKVCA